MTDIELVNLAVRLANGEVHTYRGVYTVPRNEALYVFTVGFSDPAVWRQDNTGPVPVIAYSTAALISWTERDNEAATPYIVPPGLDLDGRPFDMPEVPDAPQS